MVALVRRKDPSWLKRLLRRYENGPVLALGWPAGTNGVSVKYPDGTPVLTVAAVHQFGANIKHPGGTSYVIGPDKLAKFVSKGYAGPVAGVTGPHIIPIPQRDYMTPGGIKAVGVTRPIIEALVPALNAGKITIDGILGKAGPFAQGAFQDVIRDFTTPPNAASTIARKGDNNPLEDTGLMRQSFTWTVRPAK